MPYIRKDAEGNVIEYHGALDPEFTQARIYLSTGKLQERLDEYPDVHAHAAALGVSFDEAVDEICSRWPEWVDDVELESPAPSGAFDSGPALQEIREAYEDSHTDNEGAGDVGLVEHSGADLGGDGGEHGEAGSDVDPGGDPLDGGDYSAEPLAGDTEPVEEHQTEDVSPANLGGVLIQGDALATAKGMALMAVDDERFARVGDYDKAANEFRLNKLRSAQQAIKQGVEPAIDPPYSAEEHQALETFMPLMERIDDHAQGLRNAIREAADLEQLTAIDLLNGWPD